MKRVLTFLTMLISSLFGYSQMNGLIRGNITGIDRRPLKSASAQLFRLPDKRLLKIAVADDRGFFEFPGLVNGKYEVVVTCSGYKDFKTSELAIADSGAVILLDTITLTVQSKALKEVQVTAQKPMVENKIDRMVVNVDAFISNAGATAMEALEKSPGVTVDNDGNISLKGKQGVIVLIDGKQTYLAGTDLANYLRNMAANRLEAIEIMSQPPAKYDDSGNSGVINIRTKKITQPGFFGTVSLSYVQGFYPKSLNSLVLNLKKNKLNIFFNYSYSYQKSFSDVSIQRRFADSSGNTTARFDQSTSQISLFSNNNARLGLDYNISKKSTIGFALNGNYNPRSLPVTSIANILDGSGKIDSVNRAFSHTTDPWKNRSSNINFRSVLDTLGTDITVDLDYVLYRSRSNQVSDNFNDIPPSAMPSDSFLLQAILPADISIYSARADYSRPLAHGARLEAGAKSSLVKTDNNAQYTLFDAQTGKWVNDVGRSNHFIYRENINALYTSYSRQFKRLGMQTGLRLEQTNSTGNQLTDNTTFSRQYLQLFPTGYFTYSVSSKSKLGLSYGRRIDRPSYQDLNPFQYFLDQYTYKQGNPLLQPQISNNVELGFYFKSELSITANYTRTNGIINDVLVQNDSTKVIFQTKQNIATRDNTGVAINYNKGFTKWWSANIFLNVFENHFKGVINLIPLDVTIASFSFNINNQFRFGKGWGAELSGFYRSQMLTGGITVARPFGVMSLAGSRQMLKSKGSLRLILSDPFNIQVFRGFTRFGNIDVDITNKSDSRRLGMAFTYRFGKEPGKSQPRRRQSAVQDEQNRAGIGQQ